MRTTGNILTWNSFLSSSASLAINGFSRPLLEKVGSILHTHSLCGIKKFRPKLLSNFLGIVYGLKLSKLNVLSISISAVINEISKLCQSKNIIRIKTAFKGIVSGKFAILLLVSLESQKYSTPFLLKPFSNSSPFSWRIFDSMLRFPLQLVHH
jgi:archaellum biogenesis protein FlaJ (TadC family)